MGLALREYQKTGRDFLASRRFALLADEMRVGKTPQAILAAQAVEAKNMLVVCPAIAVPQWQNEFHRWWSANDRVPSIKIMSYDLARRWDFNAYPDYDVAIIDECHFAKNPEAQRTKAIFGKGGIGWHATRVWCLSGTPATKHAGELYPMLKAFGVTSYTYHQFCQRYCTFDWTRRNIIGTRQNMIPEVRAMLAKIMLRRTRKEVAPEMPEIAFEFLAVDPVSKVDLSPGYEQDALSGKTVGAHTEDTTRREVALAKALPLVEEIAGCLERGDYKQTVVFAWHRDAIMAVRDGLVRRNIGAHMLVGGMSVDARSEIMRTFQNGQIRVVVCQIIAAGTAIDLSAASHGYFLELDWVPGNNMQAANRLVSMMKDEPVTFDICTMPGSVDDRVQRILLRRARELKEMI